MPLTLTVKSAHDSVRRHRETAAQRVAECFRHQLPDRRLLCFLDDVDWWTAKKERGVANRGFYQPVTTNDELWGIAPDYILNLVFVDYVPAFDDFIYLHGSTCSSDLGLTMTLAHELQHFFQHAEQTDLWAANTLVLNLSKTVLKAMRLTWCDIPIEREARIVSKLTAEELFGPELVRQYIDAKIAEHVTDDDVSDWRCIRGLATAPQYDLDCATKRFLPTLKDHRRELDRAYRGLRSKFPGFPLLCLDILLSHAGE